MESKITRYSAAAVIALAAALVLLSPFGAPGNGGVVLADVQQKVAEVDTMIIRGQKRLLRPGEDGDLFEFDGVKAEFDIVKYHSREYGFVEEGYADGKLILLDEEGQLALATVMRKARQIASIRGPQ